MGCLTKFIGRLLFITILASSAYLHLNKPQQYVKEFNSNYITLTQCIGKHLPGVLPAAQGLNWILLVKVFGLFQSLCALLIIFGDGLGSLLLTLSLLMEGYFEYSSDIVNIVQWNVQKQLQFARSLFFLGAALTMICTKSSKKSSV